MPDRAANGKDRRMEAKLPQNGIGIDCVAGIAVVKRDHDRLFRKRRSLLHKRDQLVKRDRRIALLLQQAHLPLKRIRVQGGLVFRLIRVEMVIQQDRDGRAAVL